MIRGFSQLSKKEKQQIILRKINKSDSSEIFSLTSLSNKETEQLISEFSENVVSIFPFPYSVAPNFLIDGKEYLVPFVTEESSVVAAAAKSAKFWHQLGGFKTEIIGQIKNGQIHFKARIDSQLLNNKIEEWKKDLLAAVKNINEKMVKRGGGILSIQLIDKTASLSDYYQLDVAFNTCNAMGANYINSCLEGIAQKLDELIVSDKDISNPDFELIMSILSNYSPNNAVKIWVEAKICDLDDGKLGMSAEQFAQKFVSAVCIAEVDVSRAVTHNKGIYNGIDSVALATGNDWRAMEANGHAYASKDGIYKSLSHASINGDKFRFEATLPMQIGTVGGITSIHPLAKLSLEILDSPSSEELMKIIASAGLASNYAAVKALITSGIQKGHMKMHLSNLLLHLQATKEEKMQAEKFFIDNTISSSSVEKYLKELRLKEKTNN